MSSSRIAAAFLVGIALVTAAALSADLVLTRMIAKSASLEAGWILRASENPDPREIPMFGASKVVADYLPDVLGPDFFSYGFPGSSLDVSNYLIAMTIEEDSRQPIIVDLLQFQMAGIGDVRNFIPASGRPETRRLLKDAGQWQWFYGVPGLRYFGSWDFYTAGLLTDLRSETVSVRRGHAYQINEPQWDAATFRAAVEKRLRLTMTWGMDPRQIDRLDQLMKRAPQRTFVLVLSPFHRSFLVNAKGEPGYRQALSRLQDANPNMQVIDFTRTPYPDSLYTDTAHLNHAGALRFSRELRAELVRRGVL